MSVFKRKDSWVSKFQHRGQQRWTPGGPWKTKRQAQEAERRFRDRLDARRTEETCASFAERWLEEWPRPASSTRRTYAEAAKRFAEEFGPTPLGDVERLSARSWALTVPRGISRVIGIMYEDARNIGIVEANPFSRLRLPSSDRSPTITAPTWSDINGETVTIERARKRDGSIGLPKNGMARTIAYLPPAQVLDVVDRRPDDHYVFHAPRGNPLVQGSHHYAWRAVRAAAGLPETRWHDLRHFTATQLLEMGMSHFDVSIQLGHTDGGALVMERYGHPSEDAARDRLLQAFQLGSGESGSATGSSHAADPHGQAS